MNDLIVLLVIAIPVLASLYVRFTFNKYLKSFSKSGLCGQEVARKILDAHGLDKVHVVETGGTLSDHYDPTRKVVRLSKDVFHGESISSISVAAHECGHAIQDKEGYFMMRLRHAIFPVVNITTSLSFYIIAIGFLFEVLKLVYLGIGFTACGLIFQIVTLPVEFNASSRAMKELKKLNIVSDDENREVRSVLTSAALTYVAGVLASLLQIIRLILVAGNRKD